MKMERKRIKNLEFYKASYLGTPPKHISYQINKYVPNDNYGRESEYVIDPKNAEYYIKEGYPNWHIHKDCFKYKESSYAIADFEWDDSKNCYKFEWIGDRPSDLSDEERNIFEELIQYGFKVLNNNGNNKS